MQMKVRSEEDTYPNKPEDQALKELQWHHVVPEHDHEQKVQGHEPKKDHGEEEGSEAEVDIEAGVTEPIREGEDRVVEGERSVQDVGFISRIPLSVRHCTHPGTRGRSGGRICSRNRNGMIDGSGNDCERSSQLTCSRPKRVKV
jgi:hypothetical protein